MANAIILSCLMAIVSTIAVKKSFDNLTCNLIKYL